MRASFMALGPQIRIAPLHSFSNEVTARAGCPEHEGRLGPEVPRHSKGSTCRCYLPVLTGLADFRRADSSLQRLPQRSICDDRTTKCNADTRSPLSDRRLPSCCDGYAKASVATNTVDVIESSAWYWMRSAFTLAEREGFEPSRRFKRLHAFQACLFDRSSTSPRSALRAPTNLHVHTSASFLWRIRPRHLCRMCAGRGVRTSRCHHKMKAHRTDAPSHMAERVGFEPTNGYKPLLAFEASAINQLCHLSVVDFSLCALNIARFTIQDFVARGKTHGASPPPPLLSLPSPL